MAEHQAVEFLTAALVCAEETAKAATPGPWEPEKPLPTDTVTSALLGRVADCSVGTGYRPQAVQDARHIALHDPAAVLRRVAADRALLADLQAERHLVVDGDGWFTCGAATEERDGDHCYDDTRRGGPCDCGRDTRVERRIRLLAEGYGWEAS